MARKLNRLEQELKQACAGFPSGTFSRSSTRAIITYGDVKFEFELNQNGTINAFLQAPLKATGVAGEALAYNLTEKKVLKVLQNLGSSKFAVPVNIQQAMVNAFTAYAQPNNITAQQQSLFDNAQPVENANDAYAFEALKCLHAMLNNKKAVHA